MVILMFLFSLACTISLIDTDVGVDTCAVSDDGDSVIQINSDADFAELPGSGTYEDPYLIQNHIINTTSGAAIDVRDTTTHFKIMNCRLSGDYAAIRIQQVAVGTATIEGNNCTNNGKGISMAHSSNATLVDNKLTGNEESICVSYASGGISIKAEELIRQERCQIQTGGSSRHKNLSLPLSGEITVLRGGEIVGSTFEYKVTVSNTSFSVITNVAVTIVAYPNDCLELASDQTREISRIEVGASVHCNFISCRAKIV